MELLGEMVVLAEEVVAVAEAQRGRLELEHRQPYFRTIWLS
jgi:hypothetical protein